MATDLRVPAPPPAAGCLAAHPRETGGAGSAEPRSARLLARAVALAQRGDREALAYLYTRYRADVYGYVRGIVHDEHVAEDLTQHVFAKLIGVIGRYSEREVPFLAWVLRVARNAALDHRRRERCVPVGEVRATGACELEMRTRELTEALAALPRGQREVLVLRHLAGLSPGEIALRTGRSEGAVHALHHRGRKALWAELRDRGGAAEAGRAPNALERRPRK